MKWPRVIEFLGAKFIPGGRHRWKVKATNGAIVAQSSEAYRDRRDLHESLWITFAALLRWCVKRDAARARELWSEAQESEPHEQEAA